MLLSACSGASTHSSCDSEECLPSAGFTPSHNNTPNTMNFHGSALGNSFNQYSSGLLHDD
nr:hypothetical protein [Pseudomonas sp. PB120]